MNESGILPILIFNAAIPKQKGGVKRFVDELLRGFELEKLPVYSSIGREDAGRTRNFIKLLKNYLNCLKKVKLVHFVVLSPYNIPFIVLAKIYQKKIVATYHGIYSEESLYLRKIHIFIPFWIADKIFRLCCDMIVAPSSYLVKKLQLSNNVTIVPNPMSTNILEIKPLKLNIKNSGEEILLVTATDFDNQKKSDAIWLLIEAVDQISKEFSSIRLLVFGSGRNLDIFTSKYGQKSNIIFMGFRKDFWDFLYNSDAYLHISGLDTQGYSIIEAMMLGKVVLCNDLGGLLETVDSHNNYIVSLDARSIEDGIRSLITEIRQDSESFKARGQRNRLFALNRYSADIIAKRYHGIYKIVLNTNKKQR